MQGIDTIVYDGFGPWKKRGTGQVSFGSEALPLNPMGCIQQSDLMVGSGQASHHQ